MNSLVNNKRAFCPPKNTPDKDIVMTPDYLAKDIIQHFQPTGLILDPCSCLLYTSPSPRDRTRSRMPSSA